MLIINAESNLPLTNKNNLKNLLLRYDQFRRLIKLNSNSLDTSSTSTSSSTISSNLQRRNVIMPRICYFARISGTGGHQKLCLPYNGIRS